MKFLESPSMRLAMLSLWGCLLAAPVLYAQTAQPAAAGSVTAAPDLSTDEDEADAPAPAASAAAADPLALKDIRYFSRVFEVVKQAYVDPVSNQTLMKAAIDGMLSGLDPHSAFLDKAGLAQLDEDTTGQYSGLGIEVMETGSLLRIVSPIDDTPASRAGIRPGDTIVKINGKTVTPDNIDQLYDQLRGDAGTKISLTIVHAKSSTPVELHLVRERISMASVKVRELEPGYAYIRISQFQDDTSSDLERKLSGLIRQSGAPRGAVLDLRSNPGGLLTAAVGVADDFLDHGDIVSTRGRLQDANMRFSAHPGDLLNGAPMVVLVDNGTASAAEIVSGALKDNRRALIMGQKTFGKGVVQTVLPLDPEHAVKITTARYYTPNGTSIQAEGIRPDIVLPDLAVRKVDDSASFSIGSEADLPNHLANQDRHAGQGDDGSPADTDLATHDFPLSQALNVLKALAFNHSPAQATAH
ncbi:S41 family peptidase [Frateuria aurantia]